jgi:hypothetical protein
VFTLRFFKILISTTHNKSPLPEKQASLYKDYVKWVTICCEHLHPDIIHTYQICNKLSDFPIHAKKCNCSVELLELQVITITQIGTITNAIYTTCNQASCV